MKKILLFIPFIFLFAACSQDNEIIAENDDSTNFPKEQKETDGMMVLGEKLENPYSIANMEKAYADLIKTRAAGDFKIETTDLYVRFLPKDSTELLELQKDTLLELFDYPWIMILRSKVHITMIQVFRKDKSLGCIPL